MSTSSIDRANRTARVLAAYALAGGVLTLAGWAFVIPRLADWDRDGIAQMPNNALGVALAAAALILASAKWNRPARVMALLAALIGFATVFEYVSGIDLGIDTLILHREWGQRGTLAPGRMGLPGSTSLALVGTAIVLGTFRRTRRFASAGGVVTVAIGMLSLIGYLFRVDPLYAIPRFTTIALQTTTMIIALGAALIASVPERSPTRLFLGDSSGALLARRAMPVIIVLPMILGWLGLKGQHAGLFDAAFGTALLVLVLIGLLTALLLRSVTAIAVHESAISDSRDQIAGILSSITDALLTVDGNWRLLYVNAEAAVVLGQPRSALIGQRIWEVLPAAADDQAHTQLRRAMSERVSLEYEVFYPSLQRWFAKRVYPSADGGLAVYLRDVTESKNAAEAIRENEKKFALLFDKAAFGAALAKVPGGEFVDVNEAFANMFGFSREEVVGRTSLEIGINPDAALRMATIEQLQRDGFLRDMEVKLHTHSGEERIFLNNATIVELAGQKHILTTLQDITERKAAEESLRTSAEALRTADRMKDEFLATLSHELRTPLTAIVGWSQILLSTDLDRREQQIALEAIRSSAKAQAQLIEDVLDVSRIVTGKIRLERRDMNLATAIESAAATVRPAAEARRIDVRLNLDRLLPHLFGDPERIQQIVWNLLSNAIKFSPEQTVVEVSLRAENDSFVIEVKDQGRGIAPEFLPHIFERFRQADSSAARAHAGLGIGLALAKDLVELHGGTVTAESEEGRGSRFTVRLPLPSPQQRQEQQLGAAAAPSLDPLLEGVRVLYVDDRHDARLLIGTMLKQHGAKVDGAGSVEEAIAALAGDSYDVVVTDLAMPVRDGYDLLAMIRADDRWQSLPVLALTAQGRIDDEARAFSAGFRAFLRKPIESQDLAAAVAGVLREERAAQ